MSNFAESLVSWYLRLNGFFVINNLVLHRGSESGSTTDTDLLAVRLKNSKELIKGELARPDPELVKLLGHFKKNVALVVQVKSGRENLPGEAFELKRLKYCADFLGLKMTERALETFLPVAEVTVEPDWIVAKFLAAERPIESLAYHTLGLESAAKFIEGRFKSFKNIKKADRFFFPNEMVQYLAWKAGMRMHLADQDDALLS